MELDLLGKHVRHVRDNLDFTILWRSRGWSLDRVNWLINALTCEAYQHPRHTLYLILYGSHSRTDVEEALHAVDFTIQVVKGWKNPALPFTPNLDG